MEYSKSLELLNRAKKSLAGGVSSEFRKYNFPHGLFYERAEGVYIYDVDGNKYLDFALSQGPMIVGHSHPHVLKRIQNSVKDGQLFAGQHLLEIELAEKIQKHIPSAELMRFCLDGSTAVQTALRTARHVTGKNKFLRFEGHYHGWLDNVSWGLTLDVEKMGSRDQAIPLPWTSGIADNNENEFIILPWNDLSLLEQTLEKHHDEIAALITEPIMCNSGCILPQPGFLQGLRDLCDQYQIALIFDEVITGFRTSLGGAQKYFGVTPDISIFAKALASGYPISAVVGKTKWMRPLANGEVIHAGTMNSACALVAAAIGTIEVLELEGTHDRIFKLGLKLIQGLKDASKKTGQNLLVQGLGPMLHTGFADVDEVTEYRHMVAYDQQKSKRFVSMMQEKGVRIIGRGLWYISAVHEEHHIDFAIEMATKTLEEIKTTN